MNTDLIQASDNLIDCAALLVDLLASIEATPASRAALVLAQVAAESLDDGLCDYVLAVAAARAGHRIAHQANCAAPA